MGLSDKFNEFLISLDRTKNNAQELHAFFITHNWFQEDPDNESLERNFNCNIIQAIKILEDGVERRPDAILQNSIYLQTDDEWSYSTLIEINIYLQKLIQKFMASS